LKKTNHKYVNQCQEKEKEDNNGGHKGTMGRC
jgi:hypothetical protein